MILMVSSTLVILWILWICVMALKDCHRTEGKIHSTAGRAVWTFFLSLLMLYKVGAKWQCPATAASPAEQLHLIRPCVPNGTVMPDQRLNSVWGNWTWWTVGPKSSPLPAARLRFLFYPRCQLQPLLNLTPILREGKTPFTALLFPTCLLVCCSGLKLSRCSRTHAHPVGGCSSPHLCPTPRCSCPAPGQGPWQPALPLPWMGACSSNPEFEVGFNEKIEQTVAIKHNVLPNKLLSFDLPSSYFSYTCSFLIWSDLCLIILPSLP